jgi:hypothetical protein
MIELDILIEELELSNMSRVSKKYIYENLIEIRKEITKQLTLTDVSQRRELLFCGGCGNKKRGIVETDVNSQTFCKNKLCKQNNCS